MLFENVLEAHTEADLGDDLIQKEGHESKGLRNAHHNKRSLEGSIFKGRTRHGEEHASTNIY